jgi:hypothetical protein
VLLSLGPFGGVALLPTQVLTMGYVLIQRESSFSIAADDCANALAAVKALHGREPIEDSTGRHFSFVTTERFLLAETLADALAAWRWEAEESTADGSIVGLDFQGEKHGDEDLLFAALAPFVQSSSFIEMVGDDGTIFRWVFQAKAVYKVRGTVSFETPTEDHRLDPNELTGYVRFKGRGPNCSQSPPT